jgi:hypothetical protein
MINGLETHAARAMYRNEIFFFNFFFEVADTKFRVGSGCHLSVPFSVCGPYAFRIWRWQSV